MSGSKYTLAGSGLSIGVDLIIAVLPRPAQARSKPVAERLRIQSLKTAQRERLGWANADEKVLHTSEVTIDYRVIIVHTADNGSVRGLWNIRELKA